MRRSGLAGAAPASAEILREINPSTLTRHNSHAYAFMGVFVHTLNVTRAR